MIVKNYLEYILSHNVYFASASKSFYYVLIEKWNAEIAKQICIDDISNNTILFPKDYQVFILIKC